MKRILVTNDDGVRSEGIKALAAALAPLGEVITVAPVLEASASGHALTLRRPLRIEKLSERVFSVDGTPTDCVNIAIHKVLAGLPDLVVSGINKGCNLGGDVTYSGTVAGALEGMLLGVPSIAISQQRARDGIEFSQAAATAAKLAGAVLQRGLPARTLLNVNVPRVPAKGVRVTVQGEAEPRHVGRRGVRPAAPALLLDRGRGERLGAARPFGLSRGEGRVDFGDAPARGSDQP